MTISQVALSNTFGEFRSTFNDAANVINFFDTTILTGTLTVNTSASITGTTESTSTTTGSLKTAGGLGVVKNVYVGGIIDVANTTESTSVTTGAVIVDGGAGIAKNVYVGGIVDVANTAQSTGVTTGALIVDGGAGIAKNVYVGGDLQVTGNVTILGANTSISTTQITLDDNMLQIANTNTANTVDIGFFGQYGEGAANLHSGFFRDASDGVWKLFKDYNVEPSTTISLVANGYAYANLLVDTLQANNKVITTGGVDKLTTATGAVSVSASAAPTVGQGLIATSSTTATWQTIPYATTGKAIAMAMVFGS
jgi:hypothetical protein